MQTIRLASELASRSRAQVFWFSRKKEVQQGAYVRDGRILFRDAKRQREIMLASEIPLKGAHNVENTLAAICVGALMGCEAERIRASSAEFQGGGAPSGIRGHDSRGGVLQRFESDER